MFSSLEPAATSGDAELSGLSDTALNGVLTSSDDRFCDDEIGCYGLHMWYL